MKKTMNAAAHDLAVRQTDLRARLEEQHDTSTYQKRDLLWAMARDLGVLHSQTEMWYAALVELLP